MQRREFLKASALGIVSTGATAAGANVLLVDTNKNPEPRKREQSGVDPDKVYALDSHRLFPNGLPTKEWARFEAEAFSQPACGIVYHRDDVIPHGMPLGGVATGYMDLDTDGTFGFFNFFNSAVPMRGPVKHGFLGTSSGDRCWVLTTEDMTGTENASDIQYWGHYPVADLEYDLDATECCDRGYGKTHLRLRLLAEYDVVDRSRGNGWARSSADDSGWSAHQ